jgi:tetratricopeptide (TPR) repeat protein
MAYGNMEEDHRLGLVSEATGRYEEAIAAFDAARRLSHGGPMAAAAIAYVHAIRVNERVAREMLDVLLASSGVYLSAPYVAEIYAAPGDVDRAIERLEKGSDERSSAIMRLQANPRWDRIRGEPRFASLVSRLTGPATS